MKKEVKNENSAIHLCLFKKQLSWNFKAFQNTALEGKRESKSSDSLCAVPCLMRNDCHNVSVIHYEKTTVLYEMRLKLLTLEKCRVRDETDIFKYP